MKKKAIIVIALLIFLVVSSFNFIFCSDKGATPEDVIQARDKAIELSGQSPTPLADIDSCGNLFIK